MKTRIFVLLTGITLLVSCAGVNTHKPAPHSQASDRDIASQRDQLKKNTEGKGFGPQSPRNIDSSIGKNGRDFGSAPPYMGLNLCNIHFHKNAEHQGGEFTKYADNGDGAGYQSGYKYSGHFTEVESAPLDTEIRPSEHSSLSPGDTIEVHYVYSSAQVEPGPTLGACFSDSINNPQLRVEAHVYVLVNDNNALDFTEMTHLC